MHKLNFKWRSRTSHSAAAAALLLALGCSSDSTSVQVERPELQPEAAQPQLIAFAEGTPASVHWDDAAQRRYVADNENNQIWRWDDAGGLTRHATTPDPFVGSSKQVE